MRQTPFTAKQAPDDEALAQFTHIVSHDLREPLRGISGCLKLLQSSYEGKLDEKADTFISHAVDSAERMSHMLSDLVIYSRIDTRTEPFESTDCLACLKTALEELKEVIVKSDAVVTHDRLPVVRAHADLLGQVFRHLIENALKFRGIEPPAIHIGVESRDGFWTFSVRDNGMGFDPKFNDRIFQVFQRLHPRSHHAGTGMGLPICMKIVARHGGRIRVESEPGKGTCFYFTIPAQEE